jgi:hypothetical protein
MKINALLLLAMLAVPLAAVAQNQPHIDTVTVEAQKAKDDSVSRHFVQDVLKPSTVDENQYAMWKVPVCPQVYGLDPASRVFVEQRIKAMAAQVGAPVDHNDPCVTDIGIIFTTRPQAVLDAIRARRPDLVVGLNHVFKVTHPVQAWYATQTRDYNGVLFLDEDWWLNEGTPPRYASRGSRIDTGITSQIGAATILVDLNAVTGRTLTSLADYLALLALSQARPSGDCREVPTIANLLTQGCPAENHIEALSDVDIAMLTGLYHSANGPDQLQRQRLVSAMKKSLAAQRGQ